MAASKAKASSAKSSLAKRAASREGFAGSEEPEQAAREIQKRRALLIGVNHYKELTPLKYAVRDVKAIKGALEGFHYEDIQVLHDDAGPKQKPTYKNVLRALQAFVKSAKPDELLLVYFAGHGKMKNDKTWLFLSDSKWNAKKQWYDQVLSVGKLKSLLKQGASERLVLMMDACQTGREGERDVVDPSERARFIRRAYEEAEGIAVLAGSSPGQRAQETDKLGHGVFTHYVLEGLKDKGLVDTSILTVSRLAAYVTRKVSKWGKRKSIYVQMPRLQVEGMDLALVDHSPKGGAGLDSRPFPKLRERWLLEGHAKGKEIRHIAVSPKGSRFLSVSEDGTARLWNVETGRSEGKPYRHPKPVWQASFTMEGRRFATVCGKDRIRLWSIGAAQHTREIRGLTGALAFTPDGRYLAVGSESAVQFIDLRSYKWADPAVAHVGSVRAIAFLDSHEYMATCSSDRMASLWNYATREFLQAFPCTLDVSLLEEAEGRYDFSPRVALSPDGRLLATGGDDGASDSMKHRIVPLVWSTRSGKFLYAINQHSQAVTALQFSPRKSVLLTASRDGTACLWEGSNGKLLQTLSEPRIPITAAAFSADGARVILGYADGSLRIFGPA